MKGILFFVGTIGLALCIYGLAANLAHPSSSPFFYGLLAAEAAGTVTCLLMLGLCAVLEIVDHLDVRQSEASKKGVNDKR
jgi:hypothetical protein